MKINGVMLADAYANVAFFVSMVEAGFMVYISDERHRLGKVYMDGFGQRQVLIIRIRDLYRAVLNTGIAPRTLVLDNVSGLLVQKYPEASCFPLDTDNFSIAQDVYI